MLAELAESDAKGQIADIYDEIRRLWAVPYVSSVYKHMATRPGLLEWAWDGVAPVFRDGSAQEAAWRAAADFKLADTAPIPRQALRVWGISAADEATIRSLCEGFARVSPVNLVFAGLMRRILAGESRGSAATPAFMANWSPPAAVATPPAMVDPAKLPPEQRAVLMTFGKGVGDTPFVPGLYRMLARWPSLTAHLATTLAARIDAPETLAAYDGLRGRLDEVAAGCLARLPASTARSAPAAPDAAERTHLLAVLDTYRRTSPEMVAFGRLIRDAMPSPAA